MNKKLTRADAFAVELRDQLNKITGYNDKNGWSCKAGLSGTHERADVRLQCWGKKKSEVLIEVELRRGNPVINALKTWRWARERKNRTPLVLIHALSQYYRKGGSTRAKTWTEHMRFVEGLIAEDKKASLKYLLIPFTYRPKKHARGIGGAGRKRARQLATKIRKRLADV